MVETYLIEEAEKLIADPEEVDRWNELVEQSGLQGQKELNEKHNTPIPFPPMTAEEYRVYTALCPEKDLVEEYNHSTIPVRVLSLIALAKQEGYFEQIEVWYDKGMPDPIVVGVLYPDKYREERGNHLIARWGDELRSYAELKNLAIKKLKEEATTRLKREIKDAKYKLETLDETIKEHLQGRWTWL